MGPRFRFSGNGVYQALAKHLRANINPWKDGNEIGCDPPTAKFFLLSADDSHNLAGVLQEVHHGPEVNSGSSGQFICLDSFGHCSTECAGSAKRHRRLAKQ